MAGVAAPGHAAPFSMFKSAPAKPAAPARLGADWDRTVGRQRIGAPYEADGTWFVPADQPGYSAVGVAVRSDRPAGDATASGEAMGQGALTGAHATLPLPSLVDVTNMQTGRTVRVRLNDRGATKPGQVIALSARAAETLGLPEKGGEVRVSYVGRAPADRQANTPSEIAAAAPALPHSSQPIRTARAIPTAPSAPAPTYSQPPLQPVAGGFGIQAGAFANPANAERAAAMLVAAGPAVIRPVDRDGQRLYRVVVGSWADQSSAVNQLRLVQDLGFGSARIVAF